MENKNVGLLIIGIGVIVGIIVLVFNVTISDIASNSCSHGASCSMYTSIQTQMWVTYLLVALIVVIGIVLLFSKPKEKIVVKKVKEKQKKKKLDLSGLEKDEKQVIDLLLKEGKAMFQADLMEKMEMGKVKTTRLLDKLEAKQLIERKRRGMNNIVVIKD